MSLEEPSTEVVQAIDASVAWFKSVELVGIRVVEEKNAEQPKGRNKVVISDPSARALWARFYEIENNKPIFVDRDGVPKSSLAEIGHERRNGYAWYGTWPQKLLEFEYPSWRKRVSRS